MSPNIFNSIRRPRARAANVVVSLESPYSGGDSVADCDAVTVTCFEFTPSGLTNGTDSNCADYNTLIQVFRTDFTGCVFISDQESVSATLTYSAYDSKWYLTFAGGLYFTEFFDDSGGTFTLTGGNDQCSTFPPTMVLTPCA